MYAGNKEKIRDFIPLLLVNLPLLFVTISAVTISAVTISAVTISAVTISAVILSRFYVNCLIRYCNSIIFYNNGDPFGWNNIHVRIRRSLCANTNGTVSRKCFFRIY